MQGAAGKRKIEAIQAALRDDPPSRIGGLDVTAFYDRRDPEGVFGPIVSGTDAAARNVLVFHLGDSQRVVIRPSGTEPKTKIYIEVIGEPLAGDSTDEELAAATHAVQERADELAIAFTAIALKTVGIELPGYSFRMSPLVSVEHRRHFCDEFLPGLRERVVASEPTAAWIDDQLRPYGKDARDLVRGAVVAWLAELRETDAALSDAIDRAF
jgi:hypothetical protein